MNFITAEFGLEQKNSNLTVTYSQNVYKAEIKHSSATAGGNYKTKPWGYVWRLSER